MSTEVLSDVDAQLLRTLGLKQGDILRVMRFLGHQQGSVPSTSSSQNSHSGPSSFPFERSNRLPASAPAPNAHSSGSNTPGLTKFHAYNPATTSTSMPNFQPTSAHRSHKPSDTPVYRPGNLPNTKASLRDIGSNTSSNQQRSLYSYGNDSVTASTPIPDILTPGGETRKDTNKYAHESSHPTRFLAQFNRQDKALTTTTPLPSQRRCQFLISPLVAALRPLTLVTTGVQVKLRSSPKVCQASESLHTTIRVETPGTPRLPQRPTIVFRFRRLTVGRHTQRRRHRTLLQHLHTHLPQLRRRLLSTLLKN